MSIVMTVPEHKDWNDNLKYVEVGEDVILAYMEAGDPKRADLILLHGFSDSSRGWKLVMEALTEYYHIYAIDLRGHGMSTSPMMPVFPMIQMAEDIHRFVKKIGIAPCYIAGHSMGSYIAHTIAMLYPDDVCKLCLISTMAHMHETEESFKVTQDIIDGLSQSRNNDQFIAEWLGSNDRYVDREYFEYYKKTIRYMEPHVFQAAWYAMSTADHRNILRCLEIPTMVIWGKEDDLFTIEYQDEIRNLIPGIKKIVECDDADHEVPLEKPYEVAELFKEFFN